MIVDCDDCGKSYNLATISAEPWSGIGPDLSIVIDPTYGNCFSFGTSSNAVVACARPLPVTTARACISGKYKLSATTTNLSWVVITSGPWLGLTLKWNSDTSLSLYNFANQSVLYQTTPPLSPSGLFGEWHQIEIEVTLDAANGYFAVYIDGVRKCLLSGQTADQTINATSLIYFETGALMCDWVVTDTSGSVNTGPLGVTNTLPFFPANDTGPNQWTNPAGGSHYAQVNASVPPGDVSYLDSGTLTQLEEFGFTPIVGTASIYAVKAALSTKLAGPGSRSVNFVYDDGAVVLGTAMPVIDTVYTELSDSITNMNLDPNTGDAWNLGNVNAKKWGFKLTA